MPELEGQKTSQEVNSDPNLFITHLSKAQSFSRPTETTSRPVDVVEGAVWLIVIYRNEQNVTATAKTNDLDFSLCMIVILTKTDQNFHSIWGEHKSVQDFIFCQNTQHCPLW